MKNLKILLIFVIVFSVLYYTYLEFNNKYEHFYDSSQVVNKALEIQNDTKNLQNDLENQYRQSSLIKSNNKKLVDEIEKKQRSLNKLIEANQKLLNDNRKSLNYLAQQKGINVTGLIHNLGLRQ